jgi:hypothetical protein
MFNIEENTDHLENESNAPKEAADKKVRAASIWIISLLAHGVVLAALVLWVVKQSQKQEEKIITTEVMAQIEPPEVEKVKVDIINHPITAIIVPEVTEQIQIPTDEIAEHQETDNDRNEKLALGATDAISDAPQVGVSTLGSLGMGSGNSGAFGSGRIGGRKKCAMKSGMPIGSESAVDLALMWLANHQEKDGHWDSAKYEGAGTPEVDSAATGAALLAFLGAGHTDRIGKWRLNVKTAVEWLILAQRPNGSWDARNYTNGICTMAIAEAAGMGCGGSEVKKAAELAVDFLLKQQNASGCFDYSGPSARDDMSVTGWCIMGLKSAMLCNIKTKEIKDAFHKCGAFFDVTEGTKDNTSTTQGLAWYTPGTVGTGAPAGACQAIAMLTRQYLGWERSSPWLQAAADGQVSKIPADYASMDVYRVYYSFLTLFQQGGNHWKAWCKPACAPILTAQRKDGDFKGSWDKNGCHVDKGGRVLYTAFLCLTLEVPYRYESVK